MNEKSAYLLSQVDVSGQEVKRLSAQAQLFLDLEMPLLLKEIAKSARVADFGSGSGGIVCAVAAARPGSQVWGLDADPLAVEQTRQTCQGLLNVNVERFVLGAGQVSSVQNLDLAFTRFVLLHVPDPSAALKDMAACLSGSGKLYIVESDDSAMRFSPSEGWQPEMLALLERVQVGRGGSRRRGARMGEFIQGAGFVPKLVETVHYRKTVIGPSVFSELFMPVLAFYLKEAVSLGFETQANCDRYSSKTQEFMGRLDTEIDMAIFHWVGHRTDAPQ